MTYRGISSLLTFLNCYQSQFSVNCVSAGRERSHQTLKNGNCFACISKCHSIVLLFSVCVCVCKSWRLWIGTSVMETAKKIFYWIWVVGFFCWLPSLEKKFAISVVNMQFLNTYYKNISSEAQSSLGRRIRMNFINKIDCTSLTRLMLLSKFSNLLNIMKICSVMNACDILKGLQNSIVYDDLYVML